MGTAIGLLARRLDHHDPLLTSAYAAARVFALPSWFETPGLARSRRPSRLRDRDHPLWCDPGLLWRPGGICPADRPGEIGEPS